MILENCLQSNTNVFAVVFDEEVKQLREMFQLPRLIKICLTKVRQFVYVS